MDGTLHIGQLLWGGLKTSRILKVHAGGSRHFVKFEERSSLNLYIYEVLCLTKDLYRNGRNTPYWSIIMGGLKTPHILTKTQIQRVCQSLILVVRVPQDIL